MPRPQNSEFGRGSDRHFDFASYQYIFDSKNEHSKFSRAIGIILPATNTSLTAKYRIQSPAAPTAEF